MSSNGSCFICTWIVFKNHLLEVGLTEKSLEALTGSIVSTSSMLVEALTCN